jgi:dephospho-CoA kinase
MYLIGLTGGIASGKSLVAKRLADLGAVHVDADVLAREVVEPGTPALAAIAGHFGDTVIRTDGALDRQALAAVIFADPGERQRLNQIVHPAVWRRAKQLFDDATAADPHAVVVYDVPLLVEAMRGRSMDFDLVVVVDASTETRIKRLVDLRSMTREEAVHRLNSQASDTERLAIADVVIENNGSVENAMRQVDALWAATMAKHPARPVTSPVTKPLSEAVPKLD